MTEACAKGNSTAFFTGVDPGWATTDLAIAALACADRVDCVRVQELGWFGDYSSEFSMREVLRLRPPDRLRADPGVRGLPEADVGADAPAHRRRAGVQIDDWNVLYEADSLDHDVQTGFGIVEAGTASVVHFELQALARGKPGAIVEHADRVARGAGPQWPSPSARGTSRTASRWKASELIAGAELQRPGEQRC